VNHIVSVNVKPVNFIQARVLNHRLFKFLPDELDTEDAGVPYGT
jgi:hypothetical protein